MSPCSPVHGGQHGTKYVTCELLMHAAFVADEIWGFMLEPARITALLYHRGYMGRTFRAQVYQVPGILLMSPS